MSLTSYTVNTAGSYCEELVIPSGFTIQPEQYIMDDTENKMTVIFKTFSNSHEVPNDIGNRFEKIVAESDVNKTPNTNLTNHFLDWLNSEDVYDGNVV